MWVAATPVAPQTPLIDIEKNLVVKFLETTEELQHEFSVIGGHGKVV